jgi:hypothetical protein
MTDANRTELIAGQRQDEMSKPEPKLLPYTTTNGMIFEFKEMEQAKAFAAVVKSRFHLDGRVFDDAKAAARAHMSPWEQYPPVVHIDRPWWKLDRRTMTKEAFDKAWKKAFRIERQIEKLVSQFGGEWVGT